MSSPNPNTSRLSVTSYGMTDTGKARKHNEDNLLERPEIGLWAVADGMGGHAKGDMASQMIVDSLKRVHEGTTLTHYIDDIEDRILEVNKKLIEIAGSGNRQLTIGSTIVILLTYGDYYVCIWAGDSRLYRLRNNDLRQLSTDHSQVEMYVEQGLISREEALWHPHGNMITRAVGATEYLYLEMDIQKLAKHDRFLLCSDGLTKHITDLELQDFLRKGTAEECCKHLIETTLARGAGDNVTVIVVDIE